MPDMDSKASKPPWNRAKFTVLLWILVALGFWQAYKIYDFDLKVRYCWEELRSTKSKFENSLGLLKAAWIGNSESEIKDAIASNAKGDFQVKEEGARKIYMVGSLRSKPSVGFEGIEFIVFDGEIVSVRRTGQPECELQGREPLLSDASKGYVAGVDRTLTAGADPNMQNEKGRTALMAAACEGHAKVLNLLIAAGADLNIRDSDGNTALMVAADKGHLKVVELLQAAKARP